MIDLPIEGAANSDIRCQAHELWIDGAQKAGIQLAGFDPAATLEQRLNWARTVNLAIATVLTRFSLQEQHSTADQVRPCVYFAAGHGMYVPPEFICVDEGVKGRQVRRDGLDRMKLILEKGQASVLLVYKVSRLFRHAYLGYQLFQAKLVEKGLRGISVSQGIDTADKKVWKAQCHLHGLMDDLLLDTIADHCREGLVGLFMQGFVTGALTVGYKAVEVPGGRPTNRGKPRKMPAVDSATADMIRQHAAWHLGGMSLMQGLRRWRAVGGPCDPRSTTKKMSYSSYRRMWSNRRLMGEWAFGRKRNAWSTEKDGMRQIPQPESEVHIYKCEDLRILPDETFLALQLILKELEVGPRGPREPKEARLENLVVDLFHCCHCNRRFHVCGAHMGAMRCPNLDCPAPAMVCREDAVAGICVKLKELIAQDQDLIAEILAAGKRQDERSDDAIRQEIADLEKRVRTLGHRIDDLTELSGEGSEQDREQTKLKIRNARTERTVEQLAITRLEGLLRQQRRVAPDEVKACLANFDQLLTDAGSGQLGSEAVYKAADVFRRLVGRVVVRVEPRVGRKRAVVYGKFTPRLLATVAEACGVQTPASEDPAKEVEVWLRRPPRLDTLADEVRRLYEEEDLGFRAIAKKLKIGCGYIYQCYHRYYQMRGLPTPPRRPRGRRRHGE